MTKPDFRTNESTQLEDEALDWVMRFASGAASRHDIDSLQQWARQSPAHTAAFDQASRAWQLVGDVGAVSGGASVARSRVRAAASPAARPRIGRRGFLAGGLAASAAGAAILAVRPPLDLWPSWTELAADYRTEIGQQRQIKLFDSVVIDMNTRTSIALRSSGNEAKRIELLTGEAMVSTPQKAAGAVAVIAGDGSITARDARFNVRRDPNSVCVTCLDGEVRIERQSMSQTLSVGRQIAYSDRELGAIVVADPAFVTAWQGGIVIFHSTPVAEVIAEVNRYRSGKIILTNDALGRERFSARFRIENIERVIGQIEQIFGARATALPGRIVLLG